MGLREWLFAASYDLLNWGVDGRLSAYRQQTAGRTWGDVLEIGAGTGANLPFYPGGVRLTALEPNPHMAKRLRRRANKMGRAVRVLPDVGEELPLEEASFDCVVTTLVLCMVKDVNRVVREVRRVLRPGGAFFFYEHVASPRPRGRVWQDRLNPVWRTVTAGCNLNRDISGDIESAGFRSVEITPFDLSVGLPVTIPNIVGVARV